MDLPESAENLKKFKRKVRRDVIPIAADRPEDIENLKKVLREQLLGK
jgi:hypothetical protein